MITYIKNNTRKNLCFGCCACLNVCSTGSITMVPDNEGFLYPQINEETCISCGKCEKVCPIINKNIVENHPAVYACINKDDSIREKSSSGGIFTILANNIFESRGIVFGAGLDKNFNVVHKYIENIDQIDELRGAKYVQSYIGDTYKQAEEFLKQGRKVLFSGTPCQIAGLNKCLNKEYANLLTCDVICHGTPSPKVYKKYINYLSYKYKSSINKIYFRNKNKGWKKFSLKIKFKNEKTYISDLWADPFLNGFLKNLYLRPSCHTCQFSKINRVADITLGDYWGVAKYHSEMDDDRGTSVVLINTEKGCEVFEKNIVFMNYTKSKLDWAIAGNTCLIKPCAPHKHREEFFLALNKQPFEKTLKKYMLPPSILFRVMKKVLLYSKHILKYLLRKLRLMQQH